MAHLDYAVQAFNIVQDAWLEGTLSNRSHVEFSVCWSSTNVYCMLMLGDTETDDSLLYGNHDKFMEKSAYVDGYNGCTITVKPVTVTQGVGYWPPQTCTLLMSSIVKHILGMDILHGLRLQ